MAAHDDNPPEIFQKLAKMTEKKWNVYRRPITLVLNVGLFVSTIVISRKKKYFVKKNIFSVKKNSWTCVYRRSITTLVLNISLIVNSDESGMYPIFGFSSLEISME